MSLSKESFFIKHKKDGDATSVWTHFLVAKDSKTAQCKYCPAILKTLGGSTKGLHTHLSTKHDKKVITVRLSSSTSQSGDCEEPPLLKRKNISLDDYFVKTETLDDVLARMTALDGFSFSVFVTSKDLRALLLSKGYSDLPKAASTVRNRVVNYSYRIRKHVTAELTALRKEGQRFSLSLDEWTSTFNKRYMNVNIHSEKKFWSLGLIRVDVSLKAETCVDILKERLSQFDISLDSEIVAIVTDGPNVMLKVGKLVNAEHQVCFAHGIHLAVCDLLYKKSTPCIPGASENESTDFHNADSDEDDEDLESGLALEERENCPDLTNDQNIKNVIKNVRKVVLIFKRASLKNDTILQKYVKIEHGKELSLLLDCKTRWNSLYSMLERFAFLKASLRKALIDLNNPVQLEESDFELIDEIIKVLAPVKLTVEALCRTDANLCTADAALKFLFQQLNGNSSDLASKFKIHLQKRMKDRRRNELSGVLCYLQNPHSDNLADDDEIKRTFSSPSKVLIKNQIISLIERLNGKRNDEEEKQNMQVEPANTEKTDLTLKEKLQLEIENSMKIMSPEALNENHFSKIVKKEMNLYESSNSTRSYNLEQAYKYLLTIPPTSIEPERAFSAAAYMCNKFRSRLGDETLDALIFLRSYFRNSN